MTDVKTFARFCLLLVLSYLCRSEKYFDKNEEEVSLHSSNIMRFFLFLT
jgi:hypothetical protein